MNPLSHPSDYWGNLQFAATKCVLKRKRLSLKMSILQKQREDSGLSVSDFKLYCRSFVLRPLLTWFNPSISVSWHFLESSIVEPWSLHDVFFVHIINDKQCQLYFCLIISHLIRTWRTVKAHCKITCNWHTISSTVGTKGSPLFTGHF